MIEKILTPQNQQEEQLCKYLEKTITRDSSSTIQKTEEKSSMKDFLNLPNQPYRGDNSY